MRGRRREEMGGRGHGLQISQVLVERLRSEGELTSDSKATVRRMASAPKLSAPLLKSFSILRPSLSGYI